MMEARELQSHEFDSHLLYLFQAMYDETPMPGGLDADYFFSTWRRMMDLGIARTWETDRAVLGACFMPNTFSGKRVGLVSFWFAMSVVRGSDSSKELIQAFEKAAVEEGCIAVYAASHSVLPEKLARAYCRNGYSPDETQFRKLL